MKKSLTSVLITLLVISFSSLLSAQNQICNPQDQIAINKIRTDFGVPPIPNCCDWDAVTCDNVPPYRVTDLLISNSNISGLIPAAIGDLSSLLVLELVNVPIITGISPAITKLTNLVTLVVSHASLSGPIPTFLVNIKNLQFLDLSFNALAGTIPPQISQLTNFQVLNLNGNKLTGTIPQSFIKIDFLGFNVSYNNLCGEIPQGGSLQSFGIDSYFHNKCLCGAPLPPCM